MATDPEKEISAEDRWRRLALLTAPTRQKKLYRFHSKDFIVPLAGMAVAGLGIWAGMTYSSRFFPLIGLGGFIAYFGMLKISDPPPALSRSLGALRSVWFGLGLLIVAVMLSAGAHYPMARIIGSNFAPAYSESRFYVEEDQCMEREQRETCGGVRIVGKSKFHSSDPYWQYMLNNWMVMALGPAMGVLLIWLFWVKFCTIRAKGSDKNQSICTP